MVTSINSNVNILNIIQYPCITEKAKILNEKCSQIVIMVAITATKIEIKKAVEAVFDMKVERVNIIVRKGKNKKSARRYPYTEKKTKKAIVLFKDKAKFMQEISKENIALNNQYIEKSADNGSKA